MSYSMMEALFDGRIIPWERSGDMTDERQKLEALIQQEKRFLIEKISKDDQQRLEQLEKLYGEAFRMEKVDIYAHGFTLGALLMLEVMEKKEAILNA